MSGKNNVEKLSEIDGHVTRHYNVIRRLGKGAYGIVWEAVDKKSKETVAVKKIFDAFRNQTDAQRTFREIMFLLSFSNHENIIQLIGLHKANNDRDIYLVFEFMETDLHKVIKKGNILKDIHKVFIMYQLFKAIKYIHSGNVIHRDLKPSNILLNAQCHCKIADFGLARSVTHRLNDGDGDAGTDPTLTDYVATRWYRAPEILIASKKYTKGIDMWSLGCILGEMLLEKPLFPGSSTINQVERIMTTLPPPTPEDIASVSAGYGSNLLEKTPSVPRRSLRELLVNVPEHALDLISRLVVFNPNHRLTAIEALEHPYVANFHYRAYEPERGYNVIPPLRDDVQLSVEEYRNKLYAMMDDKHRNYKNLIKSKLSGKSKSRVRRLSDHINKKESSIVQNSHLNHSDSVKKKDLHFSSDDIRKEKNIQEFPKQQPQVNGKSSISQYAHNFINRNLRNFPSNHTKSCQCLTSHHRQQSQQEVPSQQQQQQQQPALNKIQRSLKTDQSTRSGLTNKSSITMNQQKLRKSIKPSQVTRHSTGSSSSSFNNTITNNHNPLPKITSNLDNLPSNLNNKGSDKQQPNNVTKHFAYSDLNVYHNSNQSQSQVIQDYLNQMIPRPTVTRTSASSKIDKPVTECNRHHHVNKNQNTNSNNNLKCIHTNHTKNHIKRNSVDKITSTPTVKKLSQLNHYHINNNNTITATAFNNLYQKYL